MPNNPMTKPSDQPKFYDVLYKIILAGLQGSGKSALLDQYIDRKFETKYIQTVGVDFKIRTLDIENKRVKLQIWDSGGAEKYIPVTRSYFQRVAAVLITCDFSGEGSFKKTQEYVEKLLKDNNPFNRQTPIILAGTKKDQLLEQAEKEAAAEGKDIKQAKRAALEDAKQKLAELQGELNKQGYNCVNYYYITSAKTGEGIVNLFTNVAKSLLQKQLEAEQDAKPTESLHSESNEQIQRPEKAGLELWNHFKEHPKRYILGFLLAASIAVVLTVPVIGQAVGLAGAIGFLVANTAWQLGLLATGAALVGFAACMLGGKLIDKIKQPREDQQERLLEHEKTSDYTNPSDTATISETSNIAGQPVYDHPAGMDASKTPAQTEQLDSALAPTVSPTPGARDT